MGFSTKSTFRRARMIVHWIQDTALSAGFGVWGGADIGTVSLLHTHLTHLASRPVRVAGYLTAVVQYIARNQRSVESDDCCFGFTQHSCVLYCDALRSDSEVVEQFLRRCAGFDSVNDATQHVLRGCNVSVHVVSHTSNLDVSDFSEDRRCVLVRRAHDDDVGAIA